MQNEILLRNGFVSVPEMASASDPAQLGTIISNLAYYGFAPSRTVYERLAGLDTPALVEWWNGTQSLLASVSGEDREMGRHIVYKNFPKEVLSMRDGEWIVRQIVIYFGYDYQVVAQNEEARPPLADLARLKVLALADASTLDSILDGLIGQPFRWTENQESWTKTLYTEVLLDLSRFGFKENGVKLIAELFDRAGLVVRIAEGTDVLRLCAALSDADVSLRTPVRFRHFKRAERRRLLQLLEDTKNLVQDTALRPGVWKRLFEHLRPGDYKFENVKTAYDDLYNRRTKSFNALIDPQTASPEMLRHIVGRPGEFLRRFHHYYDLFRDQAVDAISPLIPTLTTKQLLGFHRYLLTINKRKQMIYAPRSNWAAAQVVDKRKIELPLAVLATLTSAISAVLGERLKAIAPTGVRTGARLDDIKFQSNDQKLAEYGRGTVFDIPQGITFLRTASYWAQASAGTCWFDNGWNFFDANWSPVGSVCWNRQNMDDDAAIFSGDPINSRDLKGRGCQMIDLYVDRLIQQGARYALWSMLSYSNIKFVDADDVLATLQMGENAESGKTYEPSRAQMVFRLQSNTLRNYPAYIDLVQRKLVYLDVDLGGTISSCDSNADWLAARMPAFVEHLNSLPSVADLVRHAEAGDMPVLYTDRDRDITGGKAFVFQPENSRNSFTRLGLNDLIEKKENIACL